MNDAGSRERPAPSPGLVEGEAISGPARGTRVFYGLPVVAIYGRSSWERNVQVKMAIGEVLSALCFSSTAQGGRTVAPMAVHQPSNP